MNRIVPTILTADFLDFQSRLKAAEEFVPEIQLDVIDGVFSANRTFDINLLKNFPSSLKLELHLMVKEPIEWLTLAKEVSAQRVVAQVEMMSDIKKFLRESSLLGIEAGIALDLETPTEVVTEELCSYVKEILLMAVPAGYGGQQFDEKVLEKIKAVKKTVGNSVEVGVDGGLDEENIVKCKEAGANIFYLGKTFWEAKDLEKRYEELSALVK